MTEKCPWAESALEASSGMQRHALGLPEGEITIADLEADADNAGAYPLDAEQVARAIEDIPRIVAGCRRCDVHGNVVNAVARCIFEQPG